MSSGQPRLKIGPCELKDANAFVTAKHRHHKKATGHRWSLSVWAHGELVGVGIVGRPKARMTEQRTIVEAVRICTDGTPNACSALYGAVCRQQRVHGYEKAITYTLLTEPGTSLVAAGWKPTRITKGGKWDREHRPRLDDHPTEPKIRWECPCSDTPAIELPPLNERTAA